MTPWSSMSNVRVDSYLNVNSRPEINEIFCRNLGVKVQSVIILLPPSEGKVSGGNGAWKPAQGSFGAKLGATRSEVISALQSTSAAALKVRGATAEHALAANASIIGSPSLPAFERYSGVVYQGLDFESLSERERSVALESVLVVSGLGGLVAFGDKVPDYRAPMDASVTGLGKLSAFWRPHLDPIMQRLSRDHVIIDLLPQVHRAAITPTEQNWVSVNLRHRDGLGGHAAKHAKGELARWLLRHDISSLSRWRSDGWTARAS